jgi:hypothetical protein
MKKVQVEGCCDIDPVMTLALLVIVNLRSPPKTRCRLKRQGHDDRSLVAHLNCIFDAVVVVSWMGCVPI